ncbi:MAG: toll/interleukin-1 receptor domain-containing protein [Rubrivivax sp.]|nr:toll/interleukin-1 receptor domain-containing protein [Rubrivivax sp.]
MKIFLSYPSARRELALRLKLALEAEQHEVFFDRDDLAAGDAFHQPIRDALAASELFIFFVSPESVAAGSYTLAELGQAESNWPRPAGRVLPVLVAPTPRGDIPPYLLAVTLLEPRGEPVAETLAAVARLSQPPVQQLRRTAVGALVVLTLGVAAWLGWGNWQRQQALEAERQQLAAESSRAVQLCSQGSHADGFGLLDALAKRAAAPPAALTALQDCAMAWLRAARVTEGETTFAQLTAPLRPVLLQALTASQGGPRAADLRAHLGWADYLVWRDGRSPSIDPSPHYRQALLDDADNVYANAMWAHWLLSKPPLRPAQALLLFDNALKSQRDLPFVRSLQLGTMLTNDRLATEALRVLDQMRQGKEPLEASRKQRIWSYLYAPAFRPDRARRLLEALPPDNGLQTFLWLFPRDQQEPASMNQWRLLQGLLLHHAGRAEEARPDLQLLQAELARARVTGALADSVGRLLANP